MIRVVLVDDQPVVRSGLRIILESDAGLEVVGEAADGAEAVAVVAEQHPDVVLMDISMPVIDGIEATRRITRLDSPPRIVVLTTYGADENVYDALRAGASGFLVKTDSPERLVEAVRVAASGDAVLAPDITRRLIERFVGGAHPTKVPPELQELTPRELDVLRELAQGRTNAEIAKHLFLSEGTVKTHVAHLLAKLNLRDRTQAVVYAYRNGVVRQELE